MTKDFENGFNCGVIWCVARLTHMSDQQTMAKELCKNAGISIRQLRKADVADRRSNRSCDKGIKYMNPQNKE